MALFPLDNFRSPGALIRFIGVTVAGLAADLWTKAYAFAVLGPDDRRYEFIPGWLHFQLQRNHGAVFGLGEGMRALFVTVSVGAIFFLTYLFANSGKRRFYQVILGMLLAGVVGNMYDRIHFGYVRDMIHIFPRWPSFFPWIFNVADSLLCTGVFLMVLYSFFEPRSNPQHDLADQATP